MYWLAVDMGEVYPVPTAETPLARYFAREREVVLRERVRAAFLAAALRWLALRLRVAAAFLAAAWRLAGAALGAILEVVDERAELATARFAPLLGGLLSALPNALARLFAALLRRPLARSLSNRSLSFAPCLLSLLSGDSLSSTTTPRLGETAIPGMHHGMPRIGFHASHEQIPPSRLLAAVRAAEAAGFDAAMCSDHFSPWSERQGESGFAWSWLGAALEATSLSLGCVNAPGQRYHPAIIAQAAATLAEMYPGRFWVALGSGEASNEHITGAPWPDKATRNARLRECVDVMRALLRRRGRRPRRARHRRPRAAVDAARPSRRS